MVHGLGEKLAHALAHEPHEHFGVVDRGSEKHLPVTAPGHHLGHGLQFGLAAFGQLAHEQVGVLLSGPEHLEIAVLGQAFLEGPAGARGRHVENHGELVAHGSFP